MIVLHVLGNESVIRILILPWARVVDVAPIGAWQLQPANSTAGNPWAGVCRIALVDRDNPHKEVRFAGDSPVEEVGFEPSVPRGRIYALRDCCVRPLRHFPCRRETDFLARETEGSNPPFSARGRIASTKSGLRKAR
jgi:hypothetical protein